MNLKHISTCMKLTENLVNNISEECFNDIIGIVEEYINELRDETIKNASNKNMAISQAQEENLPNVSKAKDIEFVKDDIAKRKHRAQVLRDKYERRVIEKAKKEEVEKNEN